MKIIYLFFLTSMLIGTSTIMALSNSKCDGEAHTSHKIIVNKNATCVLPRLYEPENFCISDSDGNDITGQPLNVAPNQDMTFLLYVNSNADFNVEYALTCTLNDGLSAQSPKAVFIIGANGPADPNVTLVPLYGAKATWQSADGVESYSFSF